MGLLDTEMQELQVLAEAPEQTRAAAVLTVGRRVANFVTCSPISQAKRGPMALLINIWFYQSEAAATQ